MLQQFLVIPETYTRNNPQLTQKVLSEIKRQWAVHKLSFPEKMKVVMLHDTDLPGRMSKITHVSLLLPLSNGKLMHFEKVGWLGPFIRTDMNSELEVLNRYAQFEASAGDPNRTLCFVTINGELLGEIDPIRYPREAPTY